MVIKIEIKHDILIIAQQNRTEYNNRNKKNKPSQTATKKEIKKTKKSSNNKKIVQPTIITIITFIEVEITKTYFNREFESQNSNKNSSTVQEYQR